MFKCDVYRIIATAYSKLVPNMSYIYTPKRLVIKAWKHGSINIYTCMGLYSLGFVQHFASYNRAVGLPSDQQHASYQAQFGQPQPLGQLQSGYQPMNQPQGVPPQQAGAIAKVCVIMYARC